MERALGIEQRRSGFEGDDAAVVLEADLKAQQTRQEKRSELLPGIGERPLEHGLHLRTINKGGVRRHVTSCSGWDVAGAVFLNAPV